MTGGDLTAITGIKTARARQLRGLGIASPADLAALTADDLAERLRVAGVHGVARSAIESWIEQARALASSPGPGPPGEATSPAPAADRPVRAASGNGVWRAEASFVVELQSRNGEDGRRTAVHHMEGDAGEEWPGFDCERLCDWLLARLPEAPPRTAPPAPGPAGAGALPALALEAEVVDGVAEQPIAQVALGRPWAVEVRWTLAEPLPAAMAGEWVVRAAFEPIGAGEPLSAAEEPRRIAAVPGAESSYRCRLDVAAGVATSAHGGPIYRGLVVLTHEARAAGIPPAAWYVDLRPIQFGEPGD